MNVLRSGAMLVVLFGAFLSGTTGCERKEKVLDVETPGGELEVHREVDDEDVDVTLDEN